MCLKSQAGFKVNNLSFIQVLVDDAGGISTPKDLLKASFKPFNHEKRNYYNKHDIWLRIKVKNTGEIDTLKFAAFLGNQLIKHVLFKTENAGIDT